MSTVAKAIQHGSCFKVNTAACCHLIYPGYQRFFSRAAGIFGVGRRPKPRAARVTIKTWQKPETALEKSLAPRVHLIVPRQLFKEFLSRVREIVKCNGTEEKLGKMPEEEDRTTWPSQKDGKPYENKQQEVKHSLTITVKPSQAYPPRLHYWIYYSKVESVGSCRFQINLCIFHA